MAELLVVAVAVFAFALVSGRSLHSPITAPMVFTTVGLVVGRAGAGWFDVDLDGEVVAALVEATLVLVLFTDALRIDLRLLAHSPAIPVRLLGIGLPLVLLAGTAVGVVVLDGLSLVEVALVAAVLAPTDAALGHAVVTDRRLPVRVRQGLNAESGLNDGMVVPIVTVLLAAAAAEASAGGFGDGGATAARQLGFGLMVGLAAGAGGGRLLHRRARAGEVDAVYRQLAAVAIAFGAFAAAEVSGGNGFIAAFVAGMAFGHLAREECSGVQDFTEDEGELLTVVTFLVFGAVVAEPALDGLTWRVAAYAALSLTVVRMVPVLVALWRSGTTAETRLFMGWFGPRGLASILFALVVISELEGAAAEQIFTAAVWTILASIYAHGLTASPWAAHLAGHLEGVDPGAPEMQPAPELPTRRRWV